MLTLETLQEKDIRNRVSRSNMQKAESYLARIREAERRGRKLTALVSGSRAYQVEAGVEAGELWAKCGCSNEWGGFCQHSAALLLQWVRQPSTFRLETEAGSPQTVAGLEVMPIAHPRSKTPDKLPEWIALTWAARQELQAQTFTQYLEGLKMQELRSMAEHLGWTLKGNTKAALVSQMVALLTDPDKVRQIVASCNQEHQQVLWAVALLDPNVIVDGNGLLRLAKHWGPIKQYKKVDTYLAHLRDNGLTVPGQFSIYYRLVDFVPHVLMRPLSLIMAEQLPEAQGTATTPPSESRLADAGGVLQAVSQLMLMWQANAPRLRPRQPRPTLERVHRGLQNWGYVPQELFQAQQEKQLVFPKINEFTLTVPAPELALPDEVAQPLAGILGSPEYLHFVYHLMLAVGLFQPGDPITLWQAVKEQFLRLNAGQQQAVLFRAYVNLITWHEAEVVLRATPELQLKRRVMNEKFKPHHLHEQWLVARQQMVRVLACLPDDRWLSWENLVPLLSQLWPNFTSASWSRGNQYYYDTNNPSWYFTYKGQKTGAAEWDMLQGQVIRTLIEGPLHWLGLADVYAPGGKLAAFRLHGLGDLYWDRTESVSQAAAARPTPKGKPVAAAAIKTSGESIRVNPSHVSHQGHRYLEQIANLEQAQPGHFLYQLDVERVHQSFEAGHTFADLQQGWQEHLRTTMPTAIEERLRGWWQNYGQIRLYEQVSLIELADDYALAELKAVTSLNQHIIAELSPRLILIPKTAIEPLQAELQKAGYTPKVEEQ